MEGKVLTLLEKVDKKLTKLEDLGDQVSQQSERIKELEKCIKIISGDNYVGSNKTEVVQDRQCKSENFINQMRADIENIEYNKSKLKGTRSKVQKAASFQEKCTQRSLKVRRSVHTVPSDKDEERRMKSFRRECLSKAIKWNIVDLVKAISDWQIVQFPKWLDKSEIRSIERGSDQRNCFRRFLYVLIEKDFDTMQEWLSDCSLDETVIQKVWRTYEEFSDIETNKIRMKCFHCRLVETVNVLDVVDHLFSAEIISCKLCLQISSSGLIVGAQEGLWKDIFEECRQFNYPKALVSAVKIAVTDKFTVATGNEKDVHESLINLMDDVDASDILDCNCQERCAKSFHPLSCLKSISLAGVYFSPPTKRKNDSSSESGSPNSSSSSTNSIDEELKDDRDKLTDNLSSVSRETAVKKPDLPPRVPKKNKKQSRTSRKVPDSFQKMLQREAKQIDIAHNAESSSDSVEWDCKPPAVPARNSFNKVTHMSSHRQENNPNTIRAVNVIINSGPKYNFIKSGNYERSSSSSSEQ